jgi:hypothetical protein
MIDSQIKQAVPHGKNSGATLLTGSVPFHKIKQTRVTKRSDVDTVQPGYIIAFTKILAEK